MGLTIICEIFRTFSLNDGIFHIILSVTRNIVMDMNNVWGIKLQLIIDVLINIYLYGITLFIVGLTIFCKILCTFTLNDGIFHRIFLVPDNNVMDLNNVWGTKLHLVIDILLSLYLSGITLWRSITMFCGTDSYLRNIPHFYSLNGIFHGILAIPHNIVMDLYNVMGDQVTTYH